MGGTFAIATGRHSEDVTAFAKLINRPVGIISCNGGIVTAPDNTILDTAHIPRTLSMSLIHHPLPSKVYLNAYTSEGWYTCQDYTDPENYCAQSGFTYQKIHKSLLEKQAIVKFFLIGDHPILTTLQTELQTTCCDQLTCSFSLPCCLELMPIGVSKASGVTKLCDHLGFTPKETIAFGDGENDIDMLKHVGFPKVMQNASLKVKQAIPHGEVIGHAHQLGVANYINTYINTRSL